MNEAELCAKFAVAAREDGWTVYPETSGWDLLLVGDDGTQIGVEAKGRANFEVLGQAIDRDPDSGERIGYGRGGVASGPDFKAVLVPKDPVGFGTVCLSLRILVFTLEHCEPFHLDRRGLREVPRRRIELPSGHRDAYLNHYRRTYSKRLWLPPCVPTNAAGVPSPTSLTPWRVGALKMCALLRERGWVTTEDFNRFGIDIGRWRDGGHASWLVDTGRRDGRRYVYAMRDPVPSNFPDVGWEAERDAIWAQEKA